jgi:hypothetical protein
MLTNLLATALLITGVFYYLNTTQGFFTISDLQYLLVFLTIVVVLLFFRKEGDIPSGTPLANMLSVESLEKDSQEIPCYNVPYHIIESNYGDKVVLAGYNELVGAYSDPDTLQYQDPFGTQALQRRGITQKTKLL